MAEPTPEEKMLAGFARSRYWRWLRDYLIERREQLLHANITDTNDLWKRQGALIELNRLLRAPSLVLDYLRSQREAADRPQDNPDQTDADPGLGPHDRPTSFLRSIYDES